jgi:hypothetical protein
MLRSSLVDGAERPRRVDAFGVVWLSGDATSNTLFPTLSWKLARGSAGSSSSGAALRLKRFWRVGEDLVEFACCELLLTLLGVRLILDEEAAFHVFRLEVGVCTWKSFSFFDFRRNGLLEKNPDRFFCIDLSGEDAIPGIWTPLTGSPLVGEFFPDMGSALV